MKKLICLLTALALLLGLSCSLAASDRIIRDDAGLLTEAVSGVPNSPEPTAPKPKISIPGRWAAAAACSSSSI